MNTVNTIAYHQEGNYLLPDLVPPALPKIGVWGMRRRDFLRKHHDGLYTGLLLSGKLNAHLEDVDRLAEECSFIWLTRWPVLKASLNSSRPKIK